MTQICPCTLYEIAIVAGFAVYVTAIVAVYRKTHNTSKPSAVVETRNKTRSPRLSSVTEKSISPSEDSNSAFLKEINEKLSNIDAIAKFTKTRSMADRFAEKEEKIDRTDPVRAKISKTVKTLKSDESQQPDESKHETIAERTEELA